MSTIPVTARVRRKKAPGGGSTFTRWFGLLAICFGIMTVFFNITATFTDLIPLQTALQISSPELIWVTSAYSLVIASLVLTGGTVGDLIGRRRLFLLGLLVLVGANLIIVFSASAVGAIAGQAIMGLGAAMMLPTSLAIVSHTFDDARERTQAIGLWAASSGVGMALGPLVAGAVLQTAGWNTVYIVPAVAAALVVVPARLFVTESRHPGRRLDIPGVVLATLAILALVFAVIDGGHNGFGSPRIVGSFIIAGLAVVAFIIVELRASSPMMDLRLFRSSSYASIMVIGVGSLFAFNALGLLLLFLFQRGQQLSPADAGWRLLPLFLAFIVASAAGPRLVHAIGVKLTITTGLLLLAAGSAVMLAIETATSYAAIWPILLVLGAGLGLLLAPTTAAAMQSVRREHAGMASASVNMFRQIGGVLGASIIGTILTSSFASELPRELSRRAVPDPVVDAVVAAVASGSSAQPPAGPVGAAVASAISDSLTTAIHNGFVVVLIAAVVVAVPTLLFVHSRPAPPTAD
ncbi:MFS transporter [Herbiconiux sp. P16]|uniref:MFS transporter n=1 Tax=Herbiconiux wuyangfengii TaxID=3342794 RepID=UPI0035B8FBDB